MWEGRAAMASRELWMEGVTEEKNRSEYTPMWELMSDLLCRDDVMNSKRNQIISS